MEDTDEVQANDCIKYQNCIPTHSMCHFISSSSLYTHIA